MGIIGNVFVVKSGGMRNPHADILGSCMSFDAVESVFPGDLFPSPNRVIEEEKCRHHEKRKETRDNVIYYEI
jgi:hypothetical protein